MSKIILFDGTNTDMWTNLDGTPINWILEDGAMTVNHGCIVSKVAYGDAHIHLEWREPDMPGKTGQEKGNSGVYIHGCYELQVLDSYGVDPVGLGDCGAIYSLYPPRVNACKPPLEWQTYDIYLRAARMDGDTVVEPAIVTILQNDQVIHNNQILPHHTPGGVYSKVVAEGPLMLQDHGNPVSFRNIWIEKL